jgi:ATP-dependent Lon protease
MSDSVEMMPLLPLRDVVIYPHMVIPLFVGRQKSIKALENAILGNKRILLVTQIEATQDEPNAVDIYDVGTVSNILQLLKLPDGTVKVLVEGVKRGKVSNINEDAGFFNAQVAEMVTTKPSQRESEVLIRSLLTQFESYVKLNKKIPAEILSSLSGIDEHIRLVDTIAAHMSLKISEKQEVLAQIDLKSRIEFLMSIMESEIDLLQIERRIRTNVKAPARILFK